uniref:AT5g22550/MQJ16_9 n=3 Tax=Arabidopsis TaxID=3701 RepID=Q940U3_ARATH|nr:AT5g22550/MQJ16_9 [Arabidopsis thaliana]AAM19964.1 AT5g22550/MQJ16_9 [Arabidopsis thaliana]
MIEEHKKRYLEMFVSKTKENVVSQKIEYTNLKDPIFKLRWILPTLRSDLLLLENQVPLFLLKVLLETSKLAPSTSLNMLAFKFFDYSIKKPEGFWEKHNNLRAKHLLDLIRKTFIPAPPPSTTPRQCCINIFNGPREYSRTETSKNICLGKISCSKEITGAQTSSPPPPPRRPFLGLIVSARKLRLRGIKFMRKENVETPLDISFKSGLVEIPLLVFDDFISNLLINCVAFEQFNMSCSTEITSFVIFMGCLINTEDDATFLIEKGILENYFGTGEEVSLFFKNIGKDISFSISKSFLSNVFEGVNEYTSQGYHVHWAGFKYTHFNTPWTFLSSCAALVLLLLTIFQAFFAAYAYFRPPKNN